MFRVNSTISTPVDVFTILNLKSYCGLTDLKKKTSKVKIARNDPEWVKLITLN